MRRWNTISYKWLRTKTLDTEQKATEKWSSEWFIFFIRCRNLELLCTVLLDSSTKESVRPYLPSFRKIILEKIKGELAFFFYLRSITFVWAFLEQFWLHEGEQGCRSGKSARLTPMRPGFDSGLVHMWVEFVVGSRLAPRVYLRVLQFSSLYKDHHLLIPIRPG